MAHTIVKYYRLVIIQMEVSSLPSNLKYKSSACMHAHHILLTHHCNKNGWQLCFILPAHCYWIYHKGGQLDHRHCQLISLQHCSNTDITTQSCSAWPKTANMKCNKQQIAAQLGIGHNSMKMIPTSGHLWVCWGPASHTLTDKEYKKVHIYVALQLLERPAVDEDFAPDIMTGADSWFQHLDLKKRKGWNGTVSHLQRTQAWYRHVIL